MILLVIVKLDVKQGLTNASETFNLADEATPFGDNAVMVIS